MNSGSEVLKSRVLSSGRQRTRPCNGFELEESRRLRRTCIVQQL